MKLILQKINKIFEDIHSFSSVQLNISDDFKKEFKTITELITDEDVYIDESDNIHGRETEPHITVRYGLHTTDPKDVSDLINGFGPIEITLDKTDMFSIDEKPYDVVIAQVISPKLMKLNKLISDNLEFTTDYNEYKPHLTLAYVQKGEADKYKNKISLQGKTFKTDTLVFSAKNGQKKNINL